jgi:hypothetical protein
MRYLPILALLFGCHGAELPKSGSSRLEMRCAELPSHGDSHFAGCRALSHGADGEHLVAENAIALRDFGGDRALVGTADMQIALHRPGFPLRTLAHSAMDPRAQGNRIAYVGLMNGRSDFQPGDPTRIVVQDLKAGHSRILSENSLDSKPLPVPESEAVLVVSGRTGIASIWLLHPDAAPRQLTNIGKQVVDDDFIPVPDRDWTWIDNQTVAYQSDFGGQVTTWHLDIETGQAIPTDEPFASSEAVASFAEMAQ